MSPMRKAALIAGVAYIATFVFSIPVKFGLWADVLNKPNFILGDGKQPPACPWAPSSRSSPASAASSPPSPSTRSPSATATGPRSVS